MTQTFKTDILNIDLELENDWMEFREIEEDELKSDFDETKGLGRPSIDSTTNLEDIDFSEN